MSGIFQMRLGAMLSVLVGVLALALVALCAWSVNERYEALTSAQHAVALSNTDKRLFIALQAFRYERGDTSSALKMEPADATTITASVRNRRATVDGEVQAVLAATDLPLAGWPQASAKLKAAYDALVALRARADGELAKPVKARDAAVTSTFLPAMTAFMKTVEETSDLIEERVAEEDAEVGNYLFGRKMMWEVRSAYGQLALNILNVLVEKRGFTPAEVNEAGAIKARANAYWETAHDILKVVHALPALQSAVQGAESGYFSGTFATMQASALADLSAGKPSSIPYPEFRATLTPALDTISAAAAAFADGAIAIAEQQRAQAAFALIVFCGLMLLALVISVGGIFLVRTRVTRPIARITAAMEAVSGGDLAAEIPYSGRKDEIGEMPMRSRCSATGSRKPSECVKSASRPRPGPARIASRRWPRSQTVSTRRSARS